MTYVEQPDDIALLIEEEDAAHVSRRNEVVIAVLCN